MTLRMSYICHVRCWQCAAFHATRVEGRVGTEGRPQKAAARGHKEEPVRSWDPRSLVDKFDRMPEEDQATLKALFAGLLGVLLFLVYLVFILPRSIDIALRAFK